MLEPRHIREIIQQPATSHIPITDEGLEVLARDPWSGTLLVDGHPVASAGIVQHWPGRGEGWFVGSLEAGRWFPTIHRAARRMLALCPLDRIEAVVDCDFVQGHRWVKMFGFQLEAERMKKYHPGGRDCSLYALVRGRA